MKHPRANLDEHLTHGVRFSIAALLAGLDVADFSFVRDEIEITTRSCRGRFPRSKGRASSRCSRTSSENALARVCVSLHTDGEVFGAHVRALEAIARPSATKPATS
jgi:hypothetical protein